MLSYLSFEVVCIIKNKLSALYHAHHTFLCPCVLVFDMSTIGAWGQPIKLHIIQDHYIEHFELTGETLLKYSVSVQHL